ncbi:MAG: YhcH/YjgK/YiaL family protein [Thiocapsa sp.]|uniref:YhcH/YjgK/YiaL family protein n=1 Tax=Thiocapsa sp. TaxID=2024551 RepID=UPI001BCC3458|nr:YhcH/YjgK/YiaL family protein [Thiocapsa sp.]QVL50113.1 MAG: YhcH/YjgK/YiaL family protein [Thiocapsa sp.]
MFCAVLNEHAAWKSVLVHPVLRRSLDWLATHAVTAVLGDVSLGAAGWFANVHEYRTLPESECIWENHRRTIDVQYVIAGGERIRWSPVAQLGEPLRSIEARDREEYAAPPEAMTLLTLRAGMFAVFLPGEAHCPMIALDAPMPIRKAVVKIPLRLLES